MRIKYEEIRKTTFMPRYNRYDFLLVQFELTNEPTTFMCSMNGIFTKYLDMLFVVFVDEILIYSNSEE